MVLFRCLAAVSRRHFWRLLLTSSQVGRQRSSVKLATHFRMMCESVRGLTLTVCLAPDAQHLPRGALLMQSMFCASNSARLAPANAPAKHIIIHSGSNARSIRAQVRCSWLRTVGVRDGVDARDFSCSATIGAIESEVSRSPRRACIRGTVS